MRRIVCCVTDELDISLIHHPERAAVFQVSNFQNKEKTWYVRFIFIYLSSPMSGVCHSFCIRKSVLCRPRNIQLLNC